MQTRPRYARFPFYRLLLRAKDGLAGRLPLAKEIAARADIVRMPFPGKAIFFLSHPDDVRHVLQLNAKNYRKSFDYRFFADLLGDGLLTSEGDMWHQDRRILQSAFHKKVVQEFTGVMNAETDKLVHQWSAIAPGSVDVFADMMALTVTIIGRRLFSADVSADAERIRVLMGESIDFLVRRSQAPVDWAKYFAIPARRRYEARKAELTQIIEKYFAARWHAPLDETCTDIVEVMKQQDMPRERALEHAITLFAAGHESTASALGWCLYALAKRPKTQAFIYQELQTVRRENILEALIDETLRCYPTLPVVGREALEADNVNGVPIPQGATLVIFIYGVHHRADFWNDPDTFNVERFTEGQRARASACTHLPFGFGPRTCVGAHFAMLEMKLALDKILSTFEITEDPQQVPPKLIPMAALRSDVPVKVRVALRAAARQAC